MTFDESLKIYSEVSKKYEAIITSMMGLKSDTAIQKQKDKFDAIAQEALGKYAELDVNTLNQHYINQINEMIQTIKEFK
jgi:hypothetical protein